MIGKTSSGAASPGAPAAGRGVRDRVQGALSWLADRSVGSTMQRATFWAPALQRRLRQREWARWARSGKALVDVEQLKPRYRQALAHLSRGGRRDVGDYLEFGVYAGASLLCMYDTLVELGLDEVRLFGFDSFEGLPAGADEQDAGVWQPGSFKAEIETVRDRLAAAGVPPARATLVKGWFNETLDAATAARLGLAKAGVIMLDADLYSSSKEALDFCAPLIRDEAVLICDDWYASGGSLREGTLAELGLGQKRAFGEFLAEHPRLAAEDWGRYGPAGRIFLVSRRP